MEKRIIPTGLSAILIGGLLLTACSSQTGVSSTTVSSTGETGTAVETSNSAGAENADPFGKYEPSVKMTFARSVDNDLNDIILPKTPGETID